MYAYIVDTKQLRYLYKLSDHLVGGIGEYYLFLLSFGDRYIIIFEFAQYLNSPSLGWMNTNMENRIKTRYFRTLNCHKID